MKKVISKESYYEKLLLGLNLLCDPVINTLGPKGNNILINNDEFLPFISNDGVTIAKNIYSEDEAINTIISILKEASLKTEEEVGDGTTTTLVLLKSLILYGLEKIKKGEKPINIKKQLDNYLKEILILLEKEKRKTTKKDFFNIACTSANDEQIGKILTKAFNKVKDEKAIIIKESNNNETIVETINGYYFEAGVISNSFLLNEKEVILNDCYILILDYYLDNIDIISNIYNLMIEKQSNLVLIADGYSEELKNITIEINLENDFKIMLINTIDYEEKKNEVYEDLKYLTNTKIIKKDDNININDLGFAKEIKCSLQQTIVIGKTSKELIKHINKLNNYLKEIKDKYYIDNIKERIIKLKQKIIIIYVGGYTKTEKKELIMRYNDALCSIGVCKKGILYGSGLTLLKISEKINNEFKIVLESPIRQIMKNNNINENNIINKIIENNYQILYNVKDECFENISDTKVIDAYLVVKKTLETAFSIAGLLLTTSHLIINFHNKNNIKNYEL